jgi:hypothetical protein
MSISLLAHVALERTVANLRGGGRNNPAFVELALGAAWGCVHSS